MEKFNLVYKGSLVLWVVWPLNTGFYITRYIITTNLTLLFVTLIMKGSKIFHIVCNYKRLTISHVLYSKQLFRLKQPY